MSDDDSNLAALKHAREAFLKHIEQEQDPVKKEKLKEFIPYMEKTFSLHEIDWFRLKAIETADSARAFIESNKNEEELQISDKIFWLRFMAVMWALFLIISPILIWTGMSKVYIYKTSEGAEVMSQTFEGAKIIGGEDQMPMTFDREALALISLPTARVVAIVVTFFGLIALTLSRTGILK